MAIWCPPCKAEMSHLSEIRKLYNGDVLTIISVGVDSSETVEELRDFANKHEADWNFTISSELALRYRVQGIPTIYLIDGEGVIRYKSTGLTSASRLESEIESIL